MNRRDFMGTVGAGIAAAKLGVGSLYGYGEQTSASTESGKRGMPRQGAWIENGLIDAGGDHEPYSFLVRRGGESRNLRQFYEYEQSEKLIRQLKAKGVEVFHTHLYKGFGMAAEMPEMEDTVHTAEIVHRLGMKIDTYVQWNSLMIETFYVEEPRAKHWIQCDQWGQPIMYGGYQQSFRYSPCFSNQEFLDYLKKVLRFAVEKVKTDFVHFDNFVLFPEPDSCHCDGCKVGFRKHLKTKYSAQQLKERFGFDNIEYVTPPLWNRRNPADKMDVMRDPGFQEWVDYRCQVMADALRQMYDLIRSLNPEVVVEINPGALVGQNSTWTHGVDHSRLLPYTQAFWDEQDQTPGYLPDRRLISTIRTYKMARHYQNVVLNYAMSKWGELGAGEEMAFNQTIGFVGNNPLRPEAVKYISFYKKHRDLYVGTEDVAPVALLHSYPSITYHNSHVGLSTILAEQALIQAKIPFQLAFDEDLKLLTPERYKALILPDSECLSDEQLAAIRQYVKAGGGVLATGQTGFYDDWRRRRVEPGLKGLVDYQTLDASSRGRRRRGSVPAGPALRKVVGEGRVTYVPDIEFDGPLPPPEPYFTIGPLFWKRPKNWKQIVDELTWACRDEISLSVSGPEFLIANLVEQREKRRRMVHLVNYNRQSPSIDEIQVKCELPKGTTVRNVRFYSIDDEDGRSLNVHMDGGSAVFTVPRMKVYCVAEIVW